MNQLCKVCGEPAAGFHFGAFTCEGCKSFFGRTYNNISSISECKNNGECVINKKNRTACKACRLRKCLLVGMSKSGSRYGRRSNWFKIHCLLQEQQQHHHQAGATMAAAASLLRPHPYLPSLFHHRAAVGATLTGPTHPSSGESDSGASSADPEDDSRFTFTCKPSSRMLSTADFCFPTTDTDCFERHIPKWLPPAAFSDPGAWRDLWTRGQTASAAPDQEEPIDLSVKGGDPPGTDIDVISVEEPVKSVPLDLTLERQTADVTH